MIVRKVKRGDRFVEYGGRKPAFAVERIYNGIATTSKGTKIAVSRLASTKYYKAL